MVFIIILLVMLVLRLLFIKIIPLKMFSASNLMAAGFIICVALGIHLEYYGEPIIGIVIAIVFYFFLLLGEVLASKVKIDIDGFMKVGEIIYFSKIKILIILFSIVMMLSPLVMVLIEGQSIPQTLVENWMTYGVSERSERLVERNYSRNVTGLNAFIRGIEQQLSGFTQLGVGLFFAYSPNTAYAILAFNIFISLINNKGTRSPVLIAFLTPIFLFSANKKIKFRTIILFLIVTIVGLMLLDILLYGRQGQIATGGVADRIARSLVVNFSYGGLGLEFGLKNEARDHLMGIDYLGRMFLLPVPRVLWQGKSTLDPNWEMTEAYQMRSLESLGSITLFTPLGEALFYFGFFGVALIPFLYSFLIIILERVYSSSPYFKGLLVQVLIWAALGMRHTFYNVWGALVIQNFILIIVILIIKLYINQKTSLSYNKHKQFGIYN